MYLLIVNSRNISFELFVRAKIKNLLLKVDHFKINLCIFSIYVYFRYQINPCRSTVSTFNIVFPFCSFLPVVIKATDAKYYTTPNFLFVKRSAITTLYAQFMNPTSIGMLGMWQARIQHVILRRRNFTSLRSELILFLFIT